MYQYKLLFFGAQICFTITDEEYGLTNARTHGRATRRSFRGRGGGSASLNTRVTTNAGYLLLLLLVVVSFLSFLLFFRSCFRGLCLACGWGGGAGFLVSLASLLR